MNDPYRISVVIPTYQRCASVERALRSLAQQSISPTAYEVVVSIDGSQDGTREMVDGFHAPYALREIWQPNRGRAAACNAGIRAAIGEVLVLLDDDMEASTGLLAAHLCYHTPGSRLGILGAVPICVDESSSPVVTFVGAKFNQHLAKLAQPGKPISLRDFYSGNFSIRRDVLLQVGLFDEAFTIYGNEDLELSWRLTHAGVQFIFSPEAKTYQHYDKSIASLARDNIAKGRTAVLLAGMHPETVSDSKLNTYKQEWRIWRPVRSVLLRLSWLFPRLPNGVIMFMSWVERRRPTQLFLYYTLVLDYCFWWGVKSALHENRQYSRWPSTLTDLLSLSSDSSAHR